MDVRPVRAHAESGERGRLEAGRTSRAAAVIDGGCEELERLRETAERFREIIVAHRRAAFVRGFELRVDRDECTEQLLGAFSEHKELVAARASTLLRAAYVREHEAGVLECTPNAGVQ